MQTVSPDFTLEHPVTQFLVASLGDHAKNLCKTHQLLCAKAVLVSLNRGVDGGLTENQAATMVKSINSENMQKNLTVLKALVR